MPHEEANSQAVGVGVKTGVRLTQPFTLTPPTDIFRTSSSYEFESRRFTAGPTFQIFLPARLTIEVDALYKQIRYTNVRSAPLNTDTSETKGRSWEFPIEVKRSVLTLGGFEFLAGAGVSARHVRGTTQTEVRTHFDPPINSSTSTTVPPEIVQAWNAGFLVAAGVRLRLGAIHLEPEVRYTRWRGETFRNPPSSPVCSCMGFQSRKSSVELLVGFTVNR
jgi:opacity protein-like surface antigen